MKDIKPNTNIYPVILTGFFIAIFGFAAFFLWALTAPLGKGVVCPALVSVEGHRKAVQHLYGGIVDEICVRENQSVKKGDLLVRLSDVRPKAEFAAVRSEYVSARAQYARLIAERTGADKVIFPRDLLEDKDAAIVQILHTQKELFARRMQSLVKEKEIIRENIEAQEKYIENLDELILSRDRQVENLESELKDLRVLAEGGHYPRSNVLNMERNLDEILGKRSEELARISQIQGNLAELKLRLLKLDQDFQKDVELHISDTERRLASLEEQYYAAHDVLERTEIRSPEDGIVLSLSVHTLGGVVAPGQKIMEIVPVDENLIIEAQVQPKDIDSVYENMKADLRFPAFNTKTTPTLEGDLVSISADRIVDEMTRMPYYLAKISISSEELARLGEDKNLVPGMPVEVVLKTGERTLFRYLIDPFIERLFVSFKEE